MRFITCRLPDGVEDPAILSEDGRQVWPLSWLGLSYETLSEAIPFLTPQVRYGLSLAIAGIPALPVEAVTLESPIPAPAQDVICLGINYMAHSDEAEKYSAAAFATKHEDAIYFSKRVTRAVPDNGPIEAHTDLVKKLDYECELAVVLGRDARDVPAGQTQDYIFGYTILNDVSARDVQTAHKQWYFGKSLDGFTPIGPCIVTADAFADYPPRLGIRSFVNGEKRQNSNTALQIFDIDHVIAELAGVLGQLIGADDHEGHDGHQNQLCKTNFHSVPIPFLSHNRHPLRPAVLLLHRGCGAVCAFVALCIPEVCELQMNLFLTVYEQEQFFR